MRILSAILFFISNTIFYSCDDILCGELSDDWLDLKSKAEQKFSNQFEIENIPCDFYYINIKSTRDSIDNGILTVLHQKLYDSTKKVGWPNFVVYDRNGNYLFHDAINGVRYKR